jgi:RNA polymerase sigma-70 factor (ECF subfamily)
VGGDPLAEIDAGSLITVLEEATPTVYGYLLHRAGAVTVAEDLTSETLEAAFRAVRRGAVTRVTGEWLIGIARHKLVDHWRRQAAEQRRLSAVAAADPGRELAPPEPGDSFESTRAGRALLRLNPSQQAALTLRYVDGLSVPDTADLLGRTVAATENLLVRAKRAFRLHYAALGGELDA